MGTVAFQCASCKQVSTHEQLKGGDTSGNPPEDATHRDEHGNLWKRVGLRWMRWKISGWELYLHAVPQNPEPIDPDTDE